MFFGSNMGKRRAAVLVLVALCAGTLSGCSAQLNEREMADISQIPIAAPVDAPEQDHYAEHSEQVMLYFLSEDASSLIPVSREVSVPGGVHAARAALEALLAGPLDREEGTWIDLGLPIVARSMEICGGVAIVDLPARVRTLPQETLYAMRMAIAHTLTEFSDIQAVNVLIGGREEGFDLGATLPVGTLLRSGDLDVGTSYDRLDDLRQGGGTFTQTTTLYLPEADGRYVLTTVRSVDYARMSPIEYLYTLLEELGQEAAGGQGMAAFPAPMDYINEMPEIVRTDDGAYRAIEIQFKSSLDDALNDAGLTRGIYLAMLTHTLMGAVPGVEGLQIYIGDEMLTGLDAAHTPLGETITFSQVLATRDDFIDLLGTPVTVYTCDEQSARLVAEQRILAHGQNMSPRALLETLMTMWSDRAEMAALTEADILAFSVSGEDIAVNLSGAFADALRALDEEEAKAMVYAIVNTLTEQNRRGSVTFFFDGEQMETPLGDIEMRGRLWRNPGMVVE